MIVIMLDPIFFIFFLRVDIPKFPMITGWGVVPNYIEDWPRARDFIPLRGNHAVDPYRVYLDRMVAEDTHYNVYDAHCATHPFDDISLFSGWLACSSTITILYLPVHVMRQATLR